MSELIKITTSQQGEGLVSARQLRAYLGVKTPVEKWIPRMTAGKFTVDVDFQRIDKIVLTPTNGKRTVLDDYALTLSCAKDIAIRQNSTKGQTIRLYFIEAEKQLRPLSTPVSPIPIELVQQLADLCQKFLASSPTTTTAAVSQPPDQSPNPIALDKGFNKLPLQGRVRQLVNGYARANGISFQATWGLLYEGMLVYHRIGVYQLEREDEESIMAMLIRRGHGERLYNLAVQLFQDNTDPSAP